MPTRRCRRRRDGAWPVNDNGQHNGLPAERFVPLAELEARAADQVLTALRAARIAAYVVPTESGDRCRLWVDADERSNARDLLTGYSSPRNDDRTAGLTHDALVDDDAWAEIVAAFHASPDGPPTRPTTVAHSESPLVEEHFEPPPPPPLPSGDAISRLAWAGVLGGPGFLFVSVLLGWGIQPFLGALAIGIFIGGFVTLIIRMHDDDEPRDNNGAVI
jgi:hypothetical protein